VLRLLVLFLLALIPLQVASAQPGGTHHIEAHLEVESASVPAGGTATLALVMTPQPGWHGYWKNPGDAGVETRMEWRLPAGVQAGGLRYPVPGRLLISGLMNYVYEGRHALLVDLKVPKGLAPGTRLPVRARTDYLVCTDQVCVPESAELAAELTVAAPGAEASRNPAFDAYRKALPRPLGARAAFEVKSGKLRLAIPLPASVAVADPYFYPLTLDAARYAPPQQVARNGDTLIVEAAAAEGASPLRAVEGVLRIGPDEGLLVSAVPGPVPAAGAPDAAPAAAGGTTVLWALLGAVLGGLILNVMPCVFPILSLKALSLAKAGGDERRARVEALAYTAGVVLVCVALGATLLVLRAGGATVGWAFQLQDPRVILLLLLLVTLVALNLAGAFELPALGFGDRLTRLSGGAGAFWTGALAAFVATPCTGPFLGAALGAALILPSAGAIAVFAGLGLGLALPFLLLGFVPALRRRLPRPGPWMNRLRRILSVPMFLTALGLAWILDRQAGQAALLVGLGVTLLIGLLAWQAARRGWLAVAPALAAAALALAVLPVSAVPATGEEGGKLHAEAFSEARLAQLTASGRPVFVYFTADWCLTCKVNERAVLDQDEVAAAFEHGKVAVLVGDWTRGDAAIGRFLEKQGRSGVPLYLWYAPGKVSETLPQILTVGRVAGLADQL
jgi:thiol:disulfide interchange protein